MRNQLYYKVYLRNWQSSSNVESLVLNNGVIFVIWDQISGHMLLIQI